MGVVVDVNDAGMSLSLPNGLRGSVTRAEASDAFVAAKKKKKTTKMTKMKKKTADSSESESESESESDESDSDDDDEALTNAEPLAALFKVGQILRAVVVRSGKGKSGGKRIDLSTRLSRVCDGVAKDALVDGAAVPACVTGVEAHGFVLNFGIDDAPIGFLPRKSVRAEMASSLARGAILDVVINAVRLLPIRPRSRCERRSLRTFPVVTLHPRFPFNV
jgi:rRNA biogenesis protein RRP5